MPSCLRWPVLTKSDRGRRRRYFRRGRPCPSGRRTGRSSQSLLDGGGQLPIGVGRGRAWRVLENGATSARGLGHPHRLGYRRLQHLEAVVVPYRSKDLLTKSRPTVEHGGDNADHTETGVGEVSDVGHRLEKLADTADR